MNLTKLITILTAHITLSHTILAIYWRFSIIMKYPLHYTFLYTISYTLQYVVQLAVNCSYCTPDDGYGEYPKHVQSSCNKINILVLQLFGHFFCICIELNPSAQSCLPRLFTGVLIFKGLTTRRIYKSCVKGLNSKKMSWSVPQLFLIILCIINPLTPELNPSAQRCLTRFFTVDFASWSVNIVSVWVKKQQIHHAPRH
jgi:hypothetical protein